MAKIFEESFWEAFFRTHNLFSFASSQSPQLTQTFLKDKKAGVLDQCYFFQLSFILIRSDLR